MANERYLITERIRPRHLKVKAIAYVAPWRTGDLGWVVPNFIEHGQVCKPYADYAKYAEGEWAYRCRITIELLPDKRGHLRRVRIR